MYFFRVAQQDFYIFFFVHIQPHGSKIEIIKLRLLSS